MTVGSLFAGIGGFDLGFERAGFEIKWQVEIDPFCRRVLEKHWPQVKRYEDVREVGAATLERVDVICGGFPCKQTSVAAAITKRRHGLAGADSGLWREQRRIICELQPRIAVVENPESDALVKVQRDLAGLGYGISRYELTAAGAGAPHLRRRVFLVAHCDGARLAERGPSGSSAPASVQGVAAERNSWLSSLGGVLRVDDGVPPGMDRRKRITAAGNAVVPACAEWIARRILEAEERITAA